MPRRAALVAAAGCMLLVVVKFMSVTQCACTRVCYEETISSLCNMVDEEAQYCNVTCTYVTWIGAVLLMAFHGAGMGHHLAVV